MKNLFKKALKITIICSLLVMASCEKDLYDDSLQKTHNKSITLNQFKNETKIKDFKTLLKVPISTNGMLNRTAELSNFVIDTVAIQKYVSENNKTTYSFRVYTILSYSETDKIYNLVYTKENNVWEKAIIEFKEKANALPTENQFEDLKKIYDSKLALQTNSSPSVVCFSETYSFHCTHTGSCADTGVCDGCNLCVSITINVSLCESSGGAGPSDPNGNGPNPSQSGYIPLNPFEYTPNLFDNPVFDDPNYINAVKGQYFFDHLDYGAQVWANEHSEDYNNIIQYQINNHWSQQSQDSSIQFINAFLSDSYTQEQKNTISQLITNCANNGSTFTIDPSVNQSNSMVFNSFSDFEDFLNNQSNEGTDFTTEFPDPNQKIVSVNFSINPYADVKVKIKQIITPYSITNVSTQLVGLTLFDDWTQTDYTVNINDNEVRVDLYGVESIKIFIEGIGTFYSQSVHYVILIHKISGEIFAAYRLPE